MYGIGHYVPKVKSAIESILRSCSKAYSLALLTSSKATIGMLLLIINSLYVANVQYTAKFYRFYVFILDLFWTIVLLKIVKESRKYFNPFAISTPDF